MSVTVRLPRVLADTANSGRLITAEGSDVKLVLDSLFEGQPGLRNHILDEAGSIRPHVSVFVDGDQADLATAVDDNSAVVILQAVSGGGT